MKILLFATAFVASTNTCVGLQPHVVVGQTQTFLIGPSEARTGQILNVMGSGGYFFVRKDDFYRYTFYPKIVKFLLERKDYFVLDGSRRLYALENIKNGRGKVFDKDLGVGYLITFDF